MPATPAIHKSGLSSRITGRTTRIIQVLVACVAVLLPLNLNAQNINSPNEQLRVSNAEAPLLPLEPDTPLPHSPQKATLLSATLPGLGQIYNREIWKVPIIYALFAGAGYAIYFNHNNYLDFRQAYLAAIDDNPNTNPGERFRLFRTDNLRAGMNFYRRNLEISILAAAGIYMLNILDATVGAHLIDFDVGENLSINIMPSVIQAPGNHHGPQSSAPGLKLTFNINMP